MGSADISYRARRILYATITEYISSGQPVASRILAKNYALDVSPATIRNVLADLEDQGLLAQPHTSAGRIPTEAGFRVFVDALIHTRDVTPEDRSTIESRLKALEVGSDPVREAGRLLSSLTGAATVIATPSADEQRLSQLRFIQLQKDQLLALLVTESGDVQNRVLQLQSIPDTGELERLNRYVESLLTEKQSLASLRTMLEKDISSRRDEYQLLRKQAQAILNVAAHKEKTEAVVIAGQEELFSRSEFLDVEKIHKYLRAFEDSASLAELLDQTLAAGGVRVVIGKEADLAEIEDVSIIASRYSKAGADASLAVIGPTRIDYAKVVPLVGFTAKVLSDLLTDDE